MISPAKAEVRLEVPASPEFLRLARITAAGVASRAGLTFEEVEDLRIAIDEVCFALVGASGREGTVVLRYKLLDDGVVVEGEGRFNEPGTATDPMPLPPLSRLILDAVSDECSLESGADGPRFRLVKRRSAAPTPPATPTGPLSSG